DIKCRKAGLSPDCVVIVATIRALKMHGGLAKDQLGNEDVKAVEAGLSNLKRHIENLGKYDVPVVVAINRFITDTDAEVQVVKDAAGAMGAPTVRCNHWADGSAGTKELAETVVKVIDEGKANFKPLYPDEMPLWDKIDTIAKEIYRADGITADAKVRKQIEDLQATSAGKYPVCIAKTQYSFSTDMNAKGAPTGFTIPVREVRLSNGAEFIVVVTGDIMTMPGLPRVPAANSIGMNDEGEVVGLF
ncbi:MAG: formate--tetrahydrofolate ligase, partial [Alphaproteobacteria bacterium]